MRSKRETIFTINYTLIYSVRWKLEISAKIRIPTVINLEMVVRSFGELCGTEIGKLTKVLGGCLLTANYIRSGGCICWYILIRDGKAS
jgi:hypothetical protein